MSENDMSTMLHRLILDKCVCDLSFSEKKSQKEILMSTHFHNSIKSKILTNYIIVMVVLLSFLVKCK